MIRISLSEIVHIARMIKENRRIQAVVTITDDGKMDECQFNEIEDILPHPRVIVLRELHKQTAQEVADEIVRIIKFRREFTIVD